MAAVGWPERDSINEISNHGIRRAMGQPGELAPMSYLGYNRASSKNVPAVRKHSGTWANAKEAFTMSNDTPQQKRCTKCGRELPATTEFFYSNRGGKFGLYSRCKQCRNEVSRQWGKDHPDKRAIYSKNWINNHRPQKNALKRASYHRHKNEQREEIRARNRASYKRHPENAKASKARRKAKLYNAGGHFTAKDVRRIGELQNWRCWWCGKKCRNKYHIDHRVPLSKGGTNWPDNLVITCSFCNLSKGNKLPEEWIGRLL